MLSVGAKATSLFDREHPRAWRERGAWRFGAVGACGLARCHPTPLVETVRLHEAAQCVVAGQRLQIVSRLDERDEIVVMELDAPALVRGILRQQRATPHPEQIWREGARYSAGACEAQGGASRCGGAVRILALSGSTNSWWAQARAADNSRMIGSAQSVSPQPRAGAPDQARYARKPPSH